MAQSLNEPKHSFLLTWMQSSKHQRKRRLLTVWSSSRSADAKSCPPWLNFWKYPKLHICATITFYRIFFIFMCMGFCLHVCMHNTCVQCSGRSEKGIRCHQTGVTDGYEQSVLWVLGTEPGSSAWTASVLNIQDHLSSSIDFSLFTLYDMLHTCRHIHVFATYTFMEDTHLKVCAPFSLIAVGGLWGQGPAARYLLSFMLLELLANSVSSFYFKINIKKLNPQNHLFLQLLFLLSFCLFLWFAPFFNNWSQWG